MCVDVAAAARAAVRERLTAPAAADIDPVVRSLA
jgi:hypothetical protein